ncbi:protein FAR1-RELATED SEQUENCE 3-like [Beta vulgaris subsp. vulgaris]|uniref:protein FAR1-RELATED SEQUENCE 3-like n=1 Tax=Beta vulgaris subsp. vulgaris TaxID=3555 RepID=UPI002546D469|nr:protein FAR1-RELATED SEQUENCE 3-like [Beta vulgaris subsp. vulgaris]
MKVVTTSGTEPNVPKLSNPSQIKLLKHAADVYTLALYNDFETEYEWAMTSFLRAFAIENSELKLFEVSPEEDFSNSHTVAYDQATTELVCSCQCFTETGMLCFHIIRVMHMFSIFQIPEQYILKRWTRLAKSAVWENVQADKDQNQNALLWTPWRHAITKNFYNLVSICQSNEDARELCDKSLKELYKSVKEVFKTDQQKQQEIEDEELRRQTVENPEVIKTKGRPPKGNKRVKGHFEKRKMKTRHLNEYGTKTPDAPEVE